MTDVQVTKDKLRDDFNEVVADTEKLLKAVQSASGEKAQALRADIEQNLKAAKQRLVEIEGAAVARARAVAKSTDEYVHVHPWQSIVIASTIGAVLGTVVGLLLNRR